MRHLALARAMTAHILLTSGREQATVRHPDLRLIEISPEGPPHIGSAPFDAAAYQRFALAPIRYTFLHASARAFHSRLERRRARNRLARKARKINRA